MLARTLLYAVQAGPFARTIDERVLARVAKDGGTLRLVPGEIPPTAREPAQRLAMTLEYGGGVPVRYFPNLGDPREVRLYAGKTLPPLFRYDRVHNEFLEIAVAARVLGLAAYLWLLAALLVPSLRAASR